MSEGSKPISRGHTNVLATVFERAPASNNNHSDERLLGVRQMMPAFATSKRSERSFPQRAPLSISAEERNGFRALIIRGNQLRSALATAPLRGPDQLMKTSIYIHLTSSASLITSIFLLFRFFDFLTATLVAITWSVAGEGTLEGAA